MRCTKKFVFSRTKIQIWEWRKTEKQDYKGVYGIIRNSEIARELRVRVGGVLIAGIFIRIVPGVVKVRAFREGILESVFF